jgi:hypothetical protein
VPRGDSLVRGGTAVILVAGRQDVGDVISFLTAQGTMPLGEAP